MSIIGRNVKQSTGFEAFLPEPFPPNPLPVLDNSTLAQLEQATVLLGRLDGITELLPDVSFFIYMYVRKEAVLSSQLEGTQATMVDALRSEEKMLHGLAADVDDITRYVKAMHYGLERLREFPLSLRLILEVHEQLMLGGRATTHAMPGEVRTTQNWIGGASPSTARYVPPPPSELGRAISDLEHFLHGDAIPSALLRAGLAHAQFETLHPFADGNGRTGRLLITFYLCQQGILHRPVLYLSEFFKRNREVYFDALHAYHQKGAVTEWLSLFLEGVIEVAASATNTCRKVTELRDRDMARVASLGRAAPSATNALLTLFMQPIVSVSTIEREVRINRANANKLVDRLVAVGILQPTDPDAEYGRTFAYSDYLSIFS